MTGRDTRLNYPPARKSKRACWLRSAEELGDPPPQIKVIPPSVAEIRQNSATDIYLCGVENWQTGCWVSN